MKTVNVFAGPTRSFTVRCNEGRTAVVVASCIFDALKKARALWPTASTWQVVS